jgi:hypothetical protein
MYLERLYYEWRGYGPLLPVTGSPMDSTGFEPHENRMRYLHARPPAMGGVVKWRISLNHRTPPKRSAWRLHCVQALPK